MHCKSGVYWERTKNWFICWCNALQLFSKETYTATLLREKVQVTAGGGNEIFTRNKMGQEAEVMTRSVEWTPDVPTTPTPCRSWLKWTAGHRARSSTLFTFSLIACLSVIFAFFHHFEHLFDDIACDRVSRSIIKCSLLSLFSSSSSSTFCVIFLLLSLLMCNSLLKVYSVTWLMMLSLRSHSVTSVLLNLLHLKYKCVSVFFFHPYFSSI